MKKFDFTAMMMGMCMQACCMCMIFCVSIADMFSISEVKHFAA